MDTARLLADLNDNQRAAVTSDAQPLRILAGAGSGKTRVLTRRIAHRCAVETAEPSHVLALTFTRKAAGELRERLHQLGLRDAVAAGTFHSVAWAQLQARWSDRGVRPPTLLTSKFDLVKSRLPSNARRKDQVLDVLGEIEWATARLLTPDDYAQAADATGRRCPAPPEVVERAWVGYIDAKRERRLVDFDDLLALWRRDLTNDAETAAAARWRFRHLFVDEFQDVNPAQHALLDALLGPSSDLCVVGDPNQAIYAWNGADARFLVEFEQRWPEAETVRLVDNYRSTPQVLRAANAVLAAASGAHAAVAALVPHRAEGPEPTTQAAPTDEQEAALVARRVRDRHRPGGAWSRQAVLVRTNAQLVLLQRALRSVQVPVRVRGDGALLDQPEVRDALRLVRRSTGPFETVIAELDASAGAAMTSPGAAGADDDAPLADDADSRAANLAALARLARDYRDLGGAVSASGFVAWLHDFARSDLHDPGGDAVDLLTFHAAKGLEWPVVHLAGIEDGLVPIGHAKTSEAIAEERRLFYVALTRARDELHLTWAEQRTFRDKPSRRRPSPLLDDLARAGRGTRDEHRRTASRRGAKGTPAAAPPARRRARPPVELDPADHELFEALRAWRAGLATSSRVPAYVIAHDATLQAVANARPADAHELSQVSGFGPARLERYGADVLTIVADHPRSG